MGRTGIIRAAAGAGVYCPFGFEPVNLNTGNFYMSQADALLTELGGDFEVQRAYNSLPPDNRSEFGRGGAVLWRTFNHASGWKNIVPPERWRDAAIYQGKAIFYSGPEGMISY